MVLFSFGKQCWFFFFVKNSIDRQIERSIDRQRDREINNIQRNYVSSSLGVAVCCRWYQTDYLSLKGGVEQLRKFFLPSWLCCVIWNCWGLVDLLKALGKFITFSRKLDIISCQFLHFFYLCLDLIEQRLCCFYPFFCLPSMFGKSACQL